MSADRAGAEIIAFPGRLSRRSVADDVPCAEPPAAGLPDDRLRIALAALEAAQAEQRAAVTRWRCALTALEHSLRGLSVTLAASQQRLDQLQRPIGA